MVKYIAGDVRSYISICTQSIIEKITQELAAIIKSDKTDYLVVDVRDDDYAGGNIINAQNWPSHNFNWKVNELVEKTKDVKTVVFHCALSQIR
jgi:rhodanese-related sulfurtransferase